jgi:hypothetical protein
VRQGIEGESRIPVELRFLPRTPERFAAFHLREPGSAVEVSLKGPKGERDDAREALGPDRAVVVRVEDLPDGDDDETLTVRYPGEREFNFPFPRALATAVTETKVRILRLTHQTARVALDRSIFEGIPEGVEAQAVVEPAEITLLAPAGTLGATLRPDPVPVGHLFADGRLPEGAREFPLSFDGWRDEKEFALYRASLALPSPIRASVRFVPATTREIANRIRIAYAGTADDAQEDYDWTIDLLPGLALDGRSFQGQFRGAAPDLELLERQRADWFYGLRVPPEALQKLRSGASAEEKVRVPLGWFAGTDALRRLLVEFVPPAAYREVLLTVRRR